jgi:hypothetical protein
MQLDWPMQNRQFVAEKGTQSPPMMVLKGSVIKFAAFLATGKNPTE